MGELSGNCFEIVLRNVSGAPEEAIAGTLSSIGDKGFINYFGLQRFGQGGAGTHEVGALLLKGCWKEAVSAIMAVRQQARRYELASMRYRYSCGRGKSNICAVSLTSSGGEVQARSDERTDSLAAKKAYLEKGDVKVSHEGVAGRGGG